MKSAGTEADDIDVQSKSCGVGEHVRNAGWGAGAVEKRPRILSFGIFYPEGRSRTVIDKPILENCTDFQGLFACGEPIPSSWRASSES